MLPPATEWPTIITTYIHCTLDSLQHIGKEAIPVLKPQPLDLPHPVFKLSSMILSTFSYKVR